MASWVVRVCSPMIRGVVSGGGSDRKLEAPPSSEKVKSTKPPPLLRPQDISAAAAVTTCRPSPAAARVSTETVNSKSREADYEEKSGGEDGLLAPGSSYARTDMVSSLLDLRGGGGRDRRGLPENRARGSSWASMSTATEYDDRGDLASKIFTGCGVAAAEAFAADGQDQKGGTVWRDGLSIEGSRGPTVGYHNQDPDRQQRQQQQQQPPPRPESSNCEFPPQRFSMIPGEAAAAAATASVTEVYIPATSNRRCSTRLEPVRNVSTEGPQDPLLQPSMPLPSPAHQMPEAEINAVSPLATKVAHLSPESAAPQPHALLSPPLLKGASYSSPLPPPPELRKPRQLTARSHAPGAKGSKRIGGGGGDGGGGRGSRNRRRGGHVGDSKGENGGKPSGTGTGSVKSVSPRPATTAARRHPRGRAQSLGSKPEKEGGNRQARGKGRKQGNDGGARSKSRGGGNRCIPSSLLAERGDRGNEDDVLDVNYAEEGEETLTTPKGRKIYKGSEHGKVKVLFPNMSPWRRDRLRFDEESLWSITDQNTAAKISNIALTLPGVSTSTVVVDGTACVGGNAISFASTFDQVWAVEIDGERFVLLKGNVKKAGCRRVRFFNADFLNVLETERETIGSKQPVVFLDPPWGGVHYKKHDVVDLFLSGTPLADVCGRAAAAGARHVLLKVPTNFNITGFRDAVGSAGRVTVHIRSMRKMLLVAIDYELEPLSSPPLDPLPPSPSAVDELGDYNYCFDDGGVAVATGQEAAAGDNETVATPTASALASSSDGLDAAMESLKGASWLDNLLSKASRGPKFDQQRYQQQEQPEERQHAPEGTKQAAAAELLGILHAKPPTAQAQPRPVEAEVVDRGGSGGRGGVAESPKASSGAMVRARWRLKELLGLDTSGDGEANLDAGEVSESYRTSSTNNSTKHTNDDAASCALPNPAKGRSTDDGGCGKGLGGGVAVTTPSSQRIEAAAAVWSKTEEEEGVAAKTVIGVPREGESATEGPRRRLKEILGLKL